MSWKQHRLRLLFGLSFAILLGILFFGLRPKGYHSSNNATWIADRPGIRFGSYGMAYTDLSDNGTKTDISKSTNFTIETAIKPEQHRQKGFDLILVLHAGRDRDQLLIGQYGTSLIIMNGDDYRNRRKTKRIVLNGVFQSSKEILLSITTGEEGTNAYIDGRLIEKKEDLRLEIPSAHPVLILGNSVYGNNFWRGNIHGLAFYDYVLKPERIKRHFDKWSMTRNFSFAGQENPFSLYLFDEKKGVRALDHGNGNHALKIPKQRHVSKRRLLSLPWVKFKLNKSFIEDFVVNLLGFIPFGFILSATFMELGGTFKKRAILITVALCFIISLIIEVAQGWIPSRSSQMLDLVLNTGGGLMGARIGDRG